MLLFLLACNGNGFGLGDTPCERACASNWECLAVSDEDAAQQEGVEVPDSMKARREEELAACLDECVLAEEQEPAATEEWAECILDLGERSDSACIDDTAACGGAWPCMSDTPLYNWTAQGNDPADYVCEAG